MAVSDGFTATERWSDYVGHQYCYEYLSYIKKTKITGVHILLMFVTMYFAWVDQRSPNNIGHTALFVE